MISQIVSVFKADTSDMKAKLRDLQGEEKKLQQASVDAAEARNRSIDTWTKRIGTATVALGTVGVATTVAVKGLKAFGDETRLTAAAGAANIGRLQDAFGGLVPKMETLRFAAQAQNGVLKLTQEQMETLAKGAVALSRQGMGELTEVMDKLRGAAIKAKAEGLDDLGLSVKEGATAAETMSNIMAELNRKIAETGGAASTTADDVQRLAVAWDNAKHATLSYIGATLSLTQGAKEGKGLLFDITNVAFFGGASRSLENRKTREANASQQWLEFMNQYGAGARAPGSRETTGSATSTSKVALDPRVQLALIDERIKKGSEEALKIISEEKAKNAGPAGAYQGTVDQYLRGKGYGFGTDTAGPTIGFSTSLGATANTDVYSEYGSLQNERGLLDGIEKARTAALTDSWTQRVGAQTQRRESFLESSFGPIEDFNAYATAFGALTGAVSSSVTAWVTGSMTIGQAFKKAIGEALTALASQMTVESMKHGAYAIGSLAFGDIRGAGQHAAAAGAFGLGAGAAALAARAMGKGGTAYGQSAGAGGSTSAGGGSGGGSGGDDRDHRTGGKDTVIIAYADPFAEDNPRRRARRAEKLVRSVMPKGQEDG